MLTVLENAVATRYLKPKLDADASLDGLLYALRTSITTDPLPEDRITVQVIATEGPVTITGLHDAAVDIEVGVPTDVKLAEGQDAAAQIRLFEKAVENAFSKIEHPSAKAEFNAAIADEDADYAGGDFFAKGWRTEREDANVRQLYGVDCGVLHAAV